MTIILEFNTERQFLRVSVECQQGGAVTSLNWEGNLAFQSELEAGFRESMDAVEWLVVAARNVSKKYNAEFSVRYIGSPVPAPDNIPEEAGRRYVEMRRREREATKS